MGKFVADLVWSNSDIGFRLVVDSSWIVVGDGGSKSNDWDELPVANLTHSSSVWINASHVTFNIDVDSSNFFIK